jgi:zinc-finger binding domain of transposase IS66
MRVRRETVEHPFATLKMRMGATHFLMKTLPKVAALPAHLPHIEIAPEDTNCPCCRAPMHVIGEETSKRLDVVPAQFRVIVTHRRHWKTAAPTRHSVMPLLAPDYPITTPLVPAHTCHVGGATLHDTGNVRCLEPEFGP